MPEPTKAGIGVAARPGPTGRGSIELSRIGARSGSWGQEFMGSRALRKLIVPSLTPSDIDVKG
jgi:hypothetical protein